MRRESVRMKALGRALFLSCAGALGMGLLCGGWVESARGECRSSASGLSRGQVGAALVPASPAVAPVRLSAPQLLAAGTTSVRADSGLVVVPFAVPVAVPVAVVTAPTFLYAYSPYAQSPYMGEPREGGAPGAYGGRSRRNAHREADAPRAVGAPREVDATPEAPASFGPARGASGAVGRACLSCHAGEKPAAGLDLSDPDALSMEQRLEAIARVVSDDTTRRMPRGAALSPSDIGQLLQELSRRARE